MNMNTIIDRTFLYASLVAALCCTGCVGTGVGQETAIQNVSTEMQEQTGESQTLEMTASEAVTNENNTVEGTTPPKIGGEVDHKISYSAEEWFDEEGHFYYPFDQGEDISGWLTEEASARYIVPEAALKKASTDDLLNACKDYYFNSFMLIERPSYFLHYIESTLNMVEELYEREDLADVLIRQYQEDMYLPMDQDDGSDDYSFRAYIKENGIVLEEILLARNETFDQMTDEERLCVLEAVLAKSAAREQGEYVCNECDAFAAYVCELEELGESRWHDFIMSEETDERYKQIISDGDMYVYWLRRHT